MPEGLVIFDREEAESVDIIYFFSKTFALLTRYVTSLKQALRKNGALWISCPKLISPLSKGLKRDQIRTYVLEIGLVDVKVASINADWSGLKFVYRMKDREDVK